MLSSGSILLAFLPEKKKKSVILWVELLNCYQMSICIYCILNDRKKNIENLVWVIKKQCYLQNINIFYNNVYTVLQNCMKEMTINLFFFQIPLMVVKSGYKSIASRIHHFLYVWLVGYDFTGTHTQFIHLVPTRVFFVDMLNFYDYSFCNVLYEHFVFLVAVCVKSWPLLLYI